MCNPRGKKENNFQRPSQVRWAEKFRVHVFIPVRQGLEYWMAHSFLMALIPPFSLESKATRSSLNVILAPSLALCTIQLTQLLDYEWPIGAALPFKELTRWESGQKNRGPAKDPVGAHVVG